MNFVNDRSWSCYPQGLMATRRAFLQTFATAAAASALPQAARAQDATISDEPIPGFPPGGFPPGSTRLDFNENPLGPSPKVLEALSDNGLVEAHRYNYIDPIIDAIAKHHGVPSQNVLIGCGSTEFLQFVPWAILKDGGNIVLPTPTYSWSAGVAESMGREAVRVPLGPLGTVDVAGLKKAMTTETRILYIANPNNPTGAALDQDAVQKLVEALPEGAVFLVDEARFSAGRKERARLRPSRRACSGVADVLESVRPRRSPARLRDRPGRGDRKSEVRVVGRFRNQLGGADCWTRGPCGSGPRQPLHPHRRRRPRSAPHGLESPRRRALPASRAVFHGRYETARPANRTAANREGNLCARRKLLGHAELHARVRRYRHGQRNFLEGAEETRVKSPARTSLLVRPCRRKNCVLSKSGSTPPREQLRGWAPTVLGGRAGSSLTSDLYGLPIIVWPYRWLRRLTPWTWRRFECSSKWPSAGTSRSRRRCDAPSGLPRANLHLAATLV